MSEPAQSSAHERRRLRQTAVVLAVGLVLAAVAAAATGLAGLPGRLGAVSFLLVAALACGAASLHAGVTALIDDVRDQRVAGRRPLAALALLAVSVLLLMMVLSVASSP